MSSQENATKIYQLTSEPTLRQNRADTSWSKTPIAITGSDEKKTLYSDKYQSL